MYRNEICDPEKITSFINHYIPDAKLKTENKEKLVYTLPVERTNKFPGNFKYDYSGMKFGNKYSPQYCSFHYLMDLDLVLGWVLEMKTLAQYVW